MPAKSRKPPKKIEGPLVDRMQDRGVTVDKMAAVLGVARRAIHRLIEGKTSSLPPAKFRSLGALLGLDLEGVFKLFTRQRTAAQLILLRRLLTDVRCRSKLTLMRGIANCADWGPDNEQIDEVIENLLALKLPPISNSEPEPKPKRLLKRLLKSKQADETLPYAETVAPGPGTPAAEAAVDV